MTTASGLRYRPFFHYYAIGLSVCTYFLLFAGGMVTSTNSGLAVPDWPTTFGHNMFAFPPSMMKGGVFYEHGHRLFASLVGFLTIGICASAWALDARRWFKWAATAALALVIVQGILGGLTVRYKLPMPISAAHACTAEIFFLLTVLMAFATSRAWLGSARARQAWGGIAVLAAVFVGAVFLQILIGAVMRHSFAGLAIPTFPLAYGEAVPPFWSFGIAVNFLHTRVGAAALVGLGGWLAFRAFATPQPRLIKFLAAALAAAILLQCLLGMFAIWSGKAPLLATLHLSGGALVFATGFLLLLALRRLGAETPRPAPRPDAAGARDPRVQGSVALP